MSNENKNRHKGGSEFWDRFSNYFKREVPIIILLLILFNFALYKWNNRDTPPTPTPPHIVEDNTYKDARRYL